MTMKMGGDTPVEENGIARDGGGNVNMAVQQGTNSVVGSDRRNYFGNREELRFLNSQVMQLRKDNIDMKMELQRRDERMLNLVMTLNRNVKRVLHQPAHPQVARRRRLNNSTGGAGAGATSSRRNSSSNGNSEESDEREGVGNDVTEEELNVVALGSGNGGGNLAELSKGPKNLYSLWHEYEFGLGNRKAAKDFTAFERGRVKHVFSKRKIVWDTVSHLITAGWTSKQAIDKIYDAYGSTSVSSIIKAMKRDKQGGGHPSLCVHAI